jgi:hypothetical protein
MAYKPGDFFIGVIDFFGILVPGAVLVSLHGEFVPYLPSFPIDDHETERWIAFALASYVVGHFLLGLGVPLNNLLSLRYPSEQDRFYNEVKSKIPLPKKPDALAKNGCTETLVCAYTSACSGVKKLGDVLGFGGDADNARREAFYRAYAFVRLNSASALAEIERQMADYKLFRSLTLVFVLDLILVWCHGVPHWSRLALSMVLFVLAGHRFLFLLNWTYRITFEYFALMPKSRDVDDLCS